MLSDRFPKASRDQAAATQRARTYLTGSLPQPSEIFIQNLERQKFDCSVYGPGWACIYSKARPPAPCFTALRVSIEVNIPNNSNNLGVIATKDVDVAALVTPDYDYKDDRGCMPL
jgi:hypothetical protein